MKTALIIFLLLSQFYLLTPWAVSSQADVDWNKAVDEARDPDADFAFMHFQNIVEVYPHSRYAMQAEFAQGEYYFLRHDYSLAAETFETLIGEYPKNQEALVALAYLFKIAQLRHDTKALKNYRVKAASFSQLTFVFNEKKTTSFVSGFGHRHQLFFTIEALELYVEGKLFTKIPI